MAPPIFTFYFVHHAGPLQILDLRIPRNVRDGLLYLFFKLTTACVYGSLLFVHLVLIYMQLYYVGYEVLLHVTFNLSLISQKKMTEAQRMTYHFPCA